MDKSARALTAIWLLSRYAGCGWRPLQDYYDQYYPQFEGIMFVYSTKNDTIPLGYCKVVIYAVRMSPAIALIVNRSP